MSSSTVKNEPVSPPIKKLNSFSGLPVIDQAIAGLSAGAISTLALHPIDLIKTKMQADSSKKTEERRLFGRAKKSFQSITRTEGILGLYRGLSPNLVGSAFSWAFYFAWYSVIKQSYSKELGDGRVSHSMTSSQYMLASAEAGALTVFCTNPIWVVKTRIFTTTVGSPNSYKGLSDGLFKIAKLEGIRGLYKGLVPALFGTSHGALQFMAYEELKRWRANHQASSNKLTSDSTGKLPTLDYIWMATSSKVFASVITYPYQVVKTRLQILPSHTEKQYKGVSDTVKTILRYEGLPGFYKGLVPSTLRVLPGTCITFIVYETLSAYFRSS